MRKWNLFHSCNKKRHMLLGNLRKGEFLLEFKCMTKLISWALTPKSVLAWFGLPKVCYCLFISMSHWMIFGTWELPCAYIVANIKWNPTVFMLLVGLTVELIILLYPNCVEVRNQLILVCSNAYYVYSFRLKMMTMLSPCCNIVTTLSQCCHHVIPLSQQCHIFSARRVAVMSSTILYRDNHL